MEALAGARTLTLPSHLSDSAEPLAALARKCYPDMAILVDRSPEGWLVHLAPVGELTRAYDPDIVSVLAAIDIGCCDLMSWHRIGNVGRTVWLESMYHSWALVAWSQWLRSAAAVRPLILHVARNDDLGAPALLCSEKPTSLMGIMEDLAVELADPDTVRTAVERGLIGVGSYIAPLLRARPGDVVHLAPAISVEDGMATRRRFDFEAGLHPSHPCLAIRELLDGTCSYRKTSDPASLADDWNPKQAVLLDIDLGYFDLVPKRRREPLGTPCSISQLIEGVRPMAGAIAAVTIAYSPGSCPSARWEALVDELRSALSSLLEVSTLPESTSSEASVTRKGFMLGTHRAVSPEETMQCVAPWMKQVGITRVADITGLDQVGIPVMAAYRPDARSVAVSLGKGITPVAARVSAVMESIELWHAEHPVMTRHWGTADKLVSRWRLAEWWNLAAPAGRAFDAATPTAWVEAESLLDGQFSLVPFEAVHTDGSIPEPAGSGWFLCTSNGLASGNNIAEAQIHALCELIERDAVTLWRSSDDFITTLIAPDTVAHPGCRRLLECFDAAGLSVVLHDATTDIRIPVVLCTVFDDRADLGPQMGMGCHLSRDIAMSRALTEAAQSRLTLISGARDDLFRERYAPPQDAVALIKQFRALLEVARHADGFERLPDIATESLESDRDLVVEILRARALHPYWVDLSHPDLGVAVGRAVVPRLEPPSDLAGYHPGVRARSMLAAKRIR